jgi:O-antigen ligase
MPFAAIPVLLLLQVKSEMRNHYLLVTVFTNQLTLVFIFGIKTVGVYEGGSIFANLTVLYCSALPLTVLLLTRPHRERLSGKQKQPVSYQILKGSWMVLLALGFYSAFTAETKLMPIATTLIFGIVMFLIIEGDFDFDMLLIAIYRIFALISGLIVFSYLIRFNWAAYVVQEINILNLDSDVYFSPFSEIVGLPPRNSGPFGNPPLAAVFSVFGVSCYLSSNFERKRAITLVTLIAFGSFTGSRTFYVALLCVFFYHLIKKKLPQEVLAFWTGLVLASFSMALLIYKFLLPLISNDSVTISNLTGRSTLWKLILDDWDSSGIFGHGPNTLTKYTMENVYIGFAHAHNSFLQVLWDFGLLGFFSIIAMIFSLCIVLSKNRDSLDRASGLVLCLMVIQTEPTMRMGIEVAGWFWLVPLACAFSLKSRERVIAPNT